MNSLIQAVDSKQAKTSDVARADAVAELQGIVRDCEAATGMAAVRGHYQRIGESLDAGELARRRARAAITRDQPQHPRASSEPGQSRRTAGKFRFRRLDRDGVSSTATRASRAGHGARCDRAHESARRSCACAAGPVPDADAGREGTAGKDCTEESRVAPAPTHAARVKAREKNQEDSDGKERPAAKIRKEEKIASRKSLNTNAIQNKSAPFGAL